MKVGGYQYVFFLKVVKKYLHNSLLVSSFLMGLWLLMALISSSVMAEF